MPIIEYFKRKWDYVTKTYTSQEECYAPCDAFWKGLRLKKSREKFDCSLCHKTRAASTRYIGDGYVKICYHCLESGYLSNSKKMFQKVISTLDRLKDEIENNKQSWLKEEIVNSL